MKIIRDLLSRKSREAVKPTPAETKAADVAPVETPLADPAPNMLSAEELRAQVEEKQRKLAADEAAAAAATQADEEEADAAAAILDKINSTVAQGETDAAAPVNIWDIEDDATEVAEAPQPAPAARRRRNQTRVLGFDSQQGEVVSMFDSAPKVQGGGQTKFPVGWMLVVDGPGRGECFALEAGMSQIGRGDDQAIRLDFGDNSISRVNHAAIVYDEQTHSFMLGHGGKKNIVRLNNKPVISNETLNTGDSIKLGETTLHFVAFCTPEFNWTSGSDPKENEDVAIA